MNWILAWDFLDGTKKRWLIRKLKMYQLSKLAVSEYF